MSTSKTSVLRADLSFIIAPTHLILAVEVDESSFG